MGFVFLEFGTIYIIHKMYIRICDYVNIYYAQRFSVLRPIHSRSPLGICSTQVCEFNRLEIIKPPEAY
jgi:hypothetical protein